MRSIILLSYLPTPVMIFLYFMPLSSLKNLKISSSARSEFHIRMANRPHMDVVIEKEDRYVRIHNIQKKKSTYFTPAGLVVIPIDEWNTNYITTMLQWIHRVGYTTVFNEQLRRLLYAFDKSQNRHWGTEAHMRVVFHSLSDLLLRTSRASDFVIFIPSIALDDVILLLNP